MPSGSIAYLIDTNVLVYAYDPRDREKQDRAILVLDRLAAGGRASLSVQCLSEFFTAVTKRLPEPVPPIDALAQVELLGASFRVLDITGSVVLDACRGSAQHGLSLWDALIWAVAKLNQVPTVVTEDLPGRSSLEGVRYLNPFPAAFDPQTFHT